MTEGPKIYKNKSVLPRGTRIIDASNSALREFFFISNPTLRPEQPGLESKLTAFIKRMRKQTVWVYYPWKKVAVHCPSESIYFRLRTARNRHAIMEEEQKSYRDFSVGVVGLSVGSGIVSALAITGGPKRLKIADFDALEVTNLNRIKGTLADIGSNKALVAARAVWDIDPFAKIQIWPEGIKSETAKKFLRGSPKLDVLVDEMDSLAIKVKIRIIARTHRIPVIMATDNGDDVIIDVERFDKEPHRPLFHNRIKNIERMNLEQLSYPQWLDLATKIVGGKELTKRMKLSVSEIGKTIAGVPSLDLLLH